MSDPVISVLMPVYNAEKYLFESINSILNQSLANFELLIFNDCSTDNSEAIINSFLDSRIKVFSSQINQGYLIYLNRGINLAKGEYIARMDADDISLPQRFEKQIEFLELNKEIALVGSSAIVIDKDDTELYTLKVTSKGLEADLFWKNPFVHSSIMGRTEIFKKYYYDSKFYTAEDYYLWTQITLKYPVANIEEPLLKYRIHNESISVQKLEQQEACVKNIYAIHLSRLGFINLSTTQLELHSRVVRNRILINQSSNRELWQALRWIKILRSSNNRMRVYEIAFFNTRLREKWESCFQFLSSFQHGVKAIPLAWDIYNRHVKLKVKVLYIIRCFKAEIANLKWSK